MRAKLLAVALLASLTTFAIPALKRWQTITQSDGTQIEVLAMGDENYHYYISHDNTKYIMGDDGMLQEVSSVANAKAVERASALSEASNVRRAARAQKLAATNALIGKKKALVILVQFSDTKFTIPSPKAEYTAFANEEGYTNSYNAVGSARDYFLAQSYNQFDLTFDVVGPVTLEHGYSYYGSNDSNGDDIYAGRMITEACKAIVDSVNIADYDWDGDRMVDQVVVIYAGEGEASGGSAKTIWPHEYSLYSTAYFDSQGDYMGLFGRVVNESGKPGTNANSEIYDYCVECNGYYFNTYACINELYNGRNSGLSSTYMMGVGTLCHEFSHCLGLPDFYDYNGSNYGMGYFDLMCSGNYNGKNMLGESPAGYTAYERMCQGWITPLTLSDNQTVSDLKPLSESNVVYQLTNPGNADEYFLLENRQKSGWDAYIPSSGLMVTHVDYDSDVWEWNSVNTTDGEYYLSTDTESKNALYNDHQRMSILHADNSDVLRTYTNVMITDEKNDLYPYTSNDVNGNVVSVLNDSITDYSAPAFSLFNANTDGTKRLHARVMDIRQNTDGTVSFKYNPTVASGISETSVSGTDEVKVVYDLNGRVVASSVDEAALKAGVYIVRMTSGATKKIIIK